MSIYIFDTIRQTLSANVWGDVLRRAPSVHRRGTGRGAWRRTAPECVHASGAGGDRGELRHALSGYSITPENEQNKKQPQKPGKQRFPACKTCVPQTAQNAHTDTVWKIKEYRHIYYGIAETSKVWNNISILTLVLTPILTPILTPFFVSN